MTRAVAELPTETLLAVMQAVRAFGDFNEDNDPNGEHDFGELQGQRRPDHLVQDRLLHARI
jgi:hypothetical protein